MTTPTDTPPPTDIDALAARLRAAAERALKIAPGELTHETEGQSLAEECHNALLNENGQRVADSLNAEVGAWWIDYDEDGGGRYIDIGTYDLFKFWEQATPAAVLALLAERERLRARAAEAERERDEAADAANDATAKLGAAWMALELSEEQAAQYGDDIDKAIRDQIGLQIDLGDKASRDLRQQLAAAEADAARLRGAVAAAEWACYDDAGLGPVWFCPACGRWQETGHAVDCVTAAALAAPDGATDVRGESEDGNHS